MKKTNYFVPLLVLSSAIAVFWTYLFLRNQKRSEVLYIAPSPVMPTVEALPVATPSPLSQISPDGTNTVTVRVNGEKTDIIVNDKVIATRRTGSDGELSIPFNTWSPDNKYFFLDAKKTDGEEYLVMTKTGLPVVKDIDYYKIGDLFSQTYPDTSIESVTGWASPTLLIINAKSDKQEKMTFWFDVQTHKFIRLSSYFY